MKIAFIVGTRPEIIRLSECIKYFKNHCDVIFIHTGQNYSSCLNDIFHPDLELSLPDITLDCVENTLGKTIGNVISKTYETLSNLKPDAVIILGDTNSSLSAYSAKRLKIPIFHLEAGNRCFDQNVPEEINRKILDHISDVNICYSDYARRNLLNEGISQQYIYKFGSPMYEIIQKHKEKIYDSDILEKFNVKPNEYFLISVHREENVDDESKLINILNILHSIYTKYNKKILMTLHPRTKKRIELLNTGQDLSFINFFEPVNFTNFCSLEINAICVLSDSGALIEESSILGFKAISLRNSTERQEGMELGNVLLGSNNNKIILNEINYLINNDIPKEITMDYLNPHFSEDLFRIVISYIEIINRNIWNKIV